MTANLILSLESCAVQSYSFFVAGKPETQGSKNAFGRAYKDKEGQTRVAVSMVEQSKGLPAWRASVGRIATLMRPPDWSTSGAYMLSSVFYMPRPKLHFDKHGNLKKNGPILHCKRKDSDKLLRAINDALTGICYDDDAFVVTGSYLKIYCDPSIGPGVSLEILRLDQATAAKAIAALLQDS